jgi:hypothetical protein
MAGSMLSKMFGSLFGAKKEAVGASVGSVNATATMKPQESQSAPSAASVSDGTYEMDARSVSLSKTLEEKAPHLVSLAKTIDVSLKKNNLQTLTAKVAFVLDASGSMQGEFRKGNVQAVLDRIAVLATQFDDDGNLDLWGFASDFKKYEDVTLDNLKGYVERIQKGASGWNILPGLGASNNEPPVMMDIIKTFKNSEEPVIVYFITDGGIDKNNQIKKAIAESAHYPIYWKFVGLGGNNYGALEDLDDFTDRVIDNTDFFPIDDFKKVSDEVLYQKLLSCIDDWRKEAKQKGIMS